MMLPLSLTLEEAIDFDTLGIFGAWSALSYVLPWYDQSAPPQPSATQLDDLLRANYGSRWVSPLVRMYMKRYEENPLGLTGTKALAAVVYAKLYDRLKKLYAAMSAEYDPISNYDMTETSSDTTMHSGSDTTTTKPAEFTQTTTDKASGLDSTGDGAETNWSETELQQGTHEGESKLTHGHREEARHTLTRRGNIGVTTSQQMQLSSIELYGMGDYWEKAVLAVVEELTLPI